MKNSSREEIALDALVNWCWNTEKHLKEARRLKLLSTTIPGSVGWQSATRRLMATIRKELDRAEPDTLAALHSWPDTDPLDFLQAIPDAEG